MTHSKDEPKGHEHGHGHEADKPQKAPDTDAPNTPETPVFEGRSGALALALRARNVPVIAAEDVGDTAVKLTVQTATGEAVYELDGPQTDLEVALALFHQKGVV